MIKKERVAALTDELKKRGLDALYIGPSTDLEYIGELDTHPDERMRGLMVAASGRCFALTPLLYEEEIVKALGDVPFYAKWDDHEGPKDAFRRGCEELGIVGGKIAFNDGVRAVDMLSVREKTPFEAVNGVDVLSGQRSHKDADELALMLKASQMADYVVDSLKSFIKPGMQERVVAKKIAELFEEAGADTMSFEPIVASGPNGSMPHYSGGDRVIGENDSVILDLGGRYKSYCSDTTRTFFTGKPTDEMVKAYEIVKKAQAAGEAAVKPGATGQDVDRAARQVIIDAGYGQYFFNRVGHGIGIAVHEGPYMIEGNNVPLEPGNVFSVEPGIYIPGKFGIRIENLVYVKEDGYGEALNKSSREMTII